MFLVKVDDDQIHHLVFTWKNPKLDGYEGDVVPNVDLDYDMEAVHTWSAGAAKPEACVGTHPDNPAFFKVFRSRDELADAGYIYIDGNPLVYGTWLDYLRLTRPDRLDTEHWLEHLEQNDKAARMRRNQPETPDVPSGAGRDEIAEWVAKHHLRYDHQISEIWYLPQGADDDEIRLLEINDISAPFDGPIESLEFGIDVEGSPFHLKIADITTEQFDRIRRAPAEELPARWSLDGAKKWGRRA